MKFFMRFSGLSGVCSEMPERMRLERIERVCKSNIVSFRVLFSLETACICSWRVLTVVCKSWLVFCSVTMLWWANSRLLRMSLISSCSDTNKSSFLFMLASTLTSTSVVCRSSVSVDDSVFRLLVLGLAESGSMLICRL